jgi:hypothetical protein
VLAQVRVLAQVLAQVRVLAGVALLFSPQLAMKKPALLLLQVQLRSSAR